MPGVKTLADARQKLTILTVPPADINAITLVELTAGIDASCQVAKNGTRFSATASNTVSDPAYCDEVEVQEYGASNYEASISPYWYLDPLTGKYDITDNPVYEAAREKGTRLTYVHRDGPKYDLPWEAADIYDAYEAVSDNPQRPSESGANVKRMIPLSVHRAALHKPVVTGV